MCAVVTAVMGGVMAREKILGGRIIGEEAMIAIRITSLHDASKLRCLDSSEHVWRPCLLLCELIVGAHAY
jgi:hypothetical protein